MTSLIGLLMEGDWGVTKFLDGAHGNINSAVSTLILIFGIVLIGFGVYKGVKGFVSKKGDTNWVMVVLMIIAGAVLSTSGISTLTSLGKTGFTQINTLGSTILFPFIR